MRGVVRQAAGQVLDLDVGPDQLLFDSLLVVMETLGPRELLGDDLVHDGVVLAGDVVVVDWRGKRTFTACK